MKHTARIVPGSTIGVLGGGQLGRMMALAGKAMGYRFVTLDPTPDSPCGQVSDNQIIATYDDMNAAHQLAEQADVITYEFENVDAGVAARLCDESHVPQGSELLHTTQHRLREKRSLEAAGVPVAPYRAIDSAEALQRAVQELGVPSVLKTCTGGYDGKGQIVIRAEAEALPAYEQLIQADAELVLEKFIRFDKEISVIAARNLNGDIRTFPPSENVHVENILHLSVVPARISREIDERASALARRIAASIDVAGLIAVEVFVGTDGELYVNELAPRPHNSGHYTMDACRTSQFEQHVRAICNLPLGDPAILTPVVMVNILGQHVAPMMKWIEQGMDQPDRLNFHIHLYGKQAAKHNRKMGHINMIGDDPEAALAWVRSSPIWRDIYPD